MDHLYDNIELKQQYCLQNVERVEPAILVLLVRLQAKSSILHRTLKHVAFIPSKHDQYIKGNEGFQRINCHQN